MLVKSGEGEGRRGEDKRERKGKVEAGNVKREMEVQSDEGKRKWTS